MAVTPHGVLPRDSHEISPTIGGGTQVDDFPKGFIEGFFTTKTSAKKWGGQRDPDHELIFDMRRCWDSI